MCENLIRREQQTSAIALIGWGSLIYDPDNLPLSLPWNADGPMLPVEFCRESRDGKITLVLAPGMPRVTTLWTTLAVQDVSEARHLLADREARPKKGLKKIVGFWSPSQAAGMCAEEIGVWAQAHAFDGAVWTALGPRFHDDDRIPTIDEVLDHLRGLSEEGRAAAERYVRCTPAQISTRYRTAIEAALGWRPSCDDAQGVLTPDD